MRRLLFFLFFVFAACCLRAQDVFVGKVVDENTSMALDAVSVIFKSKDGVVLAFGMSDENGLFSFNAPKECNDSSYLEIRTLGYSKVMIENPIVNHEYEVKLKEEAFMLKDVSIKAKKFVHSNDTTKFTVDTYSRVEDRSIGDVIANMPGFEVSSSGRITYNGSSVTDFYIDGMDLLGSRYGIATRNLSHDAIASVEVIENHQRIKSIENLAVGSGTAVNLNLKEKSKMRWIGYGETCGGASSEGNALWDAALFLSAFKSKYQTMGTLKSNNVGNDIALENESMVGNNYRFSSAIPDSEDRLIEAFPQYNLQVEPRYSLLNRTHIANNSQLWNSSNDTQLRLQTTYTDQHLNNTAIQTENIYLEDSVQCRRNREDARSVERKLTAQFFVEKNSKTKYLKDEVLVDARLNGLDIAMAGNINNSQNISNNRFRVSNELQYIKPLGLHVLGVASSVRIFSHPERQEIEYGGDSDARKHSMQDVVKHGAYADLVLSYGTKLGSVLVTNQVGSALSLRKTCTEFSSDTDIRQFIEIIDNDMKVNFNKLMYHISATWDNNKTKVRFELPFDYLYYFKPLGKTKGLLNF